MTEKLKKVVNVPVIVAGRMELPELAVAAIVENKADMVCLGRGLLAEPHWPNKLLEGKIERIRPCLGCHDGCFERMALGRPLSCAVNPACGRERDYAIQPAHEIQTVMVIGGGVAGIFSPSIGAYAQILPPVAEQYSYNVDKIPFFPYGLIVYLGTYAEFLLPAFIVAGFLTRLSALGMFVFILVMTYVDINYHGADAKTIGAFFNRVPDSLIADQRLLWVFLLTVLVLKGPGLISVDALLCRLLGRAGN